MKTKFDSGHVRRARRLAFVLTVTAFVGLAFLLAGRTPHGFYWGTWRFHAEFVFDEDGCYLSYRTGPRSVGGIGYAFGLLLRFWRARPDGKAGPRWLVPEISAHYSDAVVFIPTLWIAVAALALVAICARSYLRPEIDAQHCVECRYDLRATPERCPECGCLPHHDLSRVRLADGRVRLWCIAIAGSLQLLELVLPHREYLPPYAVLIQLLAVIMASAMFLSEVLVRRRVTKSALIGWAIAVVVVAWVLFKPILY